MWILLAAALLASLIEARLVYWQVFQHQRLAGEAVNEYSATVQLPAVRGQLLDRQGRPLAVNVTLYSAFVAPDQVPPAERETEAAALAAATGKSPAEILSVLTSGSKFAYLARGLGKEAADQLRARNLKGVGLEPEQRRSYLAGGAPNTTLAANLLGFVNRDGQGQYGVEAFYQRQLAGRDGHVSSYRDLAGRQIVVAGARLERADPVNGSSLVLTVDADIQHAAEQALAAGVDRNHAESGSVLVMDTHTGGIVAWADYPTYDANQYVSTPVERFIDPVAAHQYEPGSTMKVVTLAGAVDAGKISPTSTISDPGYVVVGGVALHDWDRANKGVISYRRVLDSSLNVGAIKAMESVGGDAYYQDLQAFGFGRPSNVDVAAESSVPLRPYSEYKPSELATMSYGQGIDVNMVQMLSAINVVANGGRYVQPHVVDRIGGRVAPLAAAPARQVVSPQTATTMTEMMRSVVQYGSGSEARIPGFEYDEAGKTGTSQMPVNGEYTLDVWSSYVGFMPASNPRFTMLVVVRKPHNDTWIHNDGYIVAAPIWREVAQQIVLDWHITPTPGITKLPPP